MLNKIGSITLLVALGAGIGYAANVMISPNMGMPIPVVGTDPGPDWANNINASLSIVDSHDHTPGHGVPIPPAGMNINSDLPFLNNNATLLRSSRYSAQSAPISGAQDLGAVYVAGVDLYYNDENGNQIRLTQGGSPVGAAGTITGLPSGTASASYAAGTFTFQSATNTPATMAVGPLQIGAQIASPHTVTLGASSSLGANLSLTLPTSLPGATSLLSLDASGNMATIGTTGSGSVVLNNGPTIAGNPSFTGNPVFSGDPDVTGSIVLNGGTLNGTFFGNPIFAADVDFTGTQTLNGGNFNGTWTGNPMWTGNPTFSGTVHGNMTFDDDPMFSAAPEFTGTLAVPGTLQVTGAGELENGGVLSGSFTGTPTFTGAVTINSVGGNVAHNCVVQTANSGTTTTELTCTGSTLVAISGGCDANGAIVSSHPIFSGSSAPTGWHCTGSTGPSVETFAVCCSY